MKVKKLLLLTIVTVIGLSAPKFIAKADAERWEYQAVDGRIWVRTDEFYEGDGHDVQFSTLSEAQKMDMLIYQHDNPKQEYSSLFAEYGVDADLWDWWIKNPNYTDEQKFNFMQTTVASANNVFLWIMENDAIPMASKIDYFHNHDIRFTQDVVKYWWLENVAPACVPGDITDYDRDNHEWCMRMTGTPQEIILINGRNYFITSEDFQKCLERGTIKREEYKFRYHGEAEIHTGYRCVSTNGFDIGCMVW